MLLIELFNNTIVTDLKQVALDYLTPLLAQNVPFIPVRSLIDELKKTQSGLTIDRPLIKKILKNNPTFILTDDKIFINQPVSDQDQEEVEAEKNIQKVKANAIKQAQKEIKS